MTAAPIILVNETRTVLVTLWMAGNVIKYAEVATRGHASETWGPPVKVEVER